MSKLKKRHFSFDCKLSIPYRPGCDVCGIGRCPVWGTVMCLCFVEPEPFQGSAGPSERIKEIRGIREEREMIQFSMNYKLCSANSLYVMKQQLHFSLYYLILMA